MDDKVRTAGRGTTQAGRAKLRAEGEKRKRVKKARSAASFFFLAHKADNPTGLSFFDLKRGLLARFATLSEADKAQYQAQAEGVRLCAVLHTRFPAATSRALACSAPRS